MCCCYLLFICYCESPKRFFLTCWHIEEADLDGEWSQPVLLPSCPKDYDFDESRQHVKRHGIPSTCQEQQNSQPRSKELPKTRLCLAHLCWEFIHTDSQAPSSDKSRAESRAAKVTTLLDITKRPWGPRTDVTDLTDLTAPAPAVWRAVIIIWSSQQLSASFSYSRCTCRTAWSCTTGYLCVRCPWAVLVGRDENSKDIILIDKSQLLRCLVLDPVAGIAVALGAHSCDPTCCPELALCKDSSDEGQITNIENVYEHKLNIDEQCQGWSYGDEDAFVLRSRCGSCSFQLADMF